MGALVWRWVSGLVSPPAENSGEAGLFASAYTARLECGAADGFRLLTRSVFDPAIDTFSRPTGLGSTAAGILGRGEEQECSRTGGR